MSSRSQTAARRRDALRENAGSARHRCVALLAAGAAALACAFAGCGGSSSGGVASKSARQILAAAQAAAQSASSVHLELHLAQRSVHSSIVGDLVRGKGARVHLALLDIEYEAIVIGETAYVKASPAVLSELGVKGSKAAHNWLKGSARKGPLAGIAQNFLGDTFLHGLLAGRGGVAKAGTATVLGQKTVKLKETGRALYTGFLYVAASGTPYPIQLEKQGREHGTVTLSRWNQPVSLTPPANAIDISTLTQ